MIIVFYQNSSTLETYIFPKDDLASRAFISLKYTLRYLLQLWLANNEGERTTFVEISQIVLEITRQIYDRREWAEHGARGGPFVQRNVTFVSSGRKF